MLRHRLVSGTILVLLLALLAWFDQLFASGEDSVANGFLLAIFAILIVVPLLALEVSAMLQRVGIQTSGWISVFGAMLLCLGMWLAASAQGDTGLAIGATILAVVAAATYIDQTRGRTTRGVLACVSGTVFTVAYAGGLLGFWLMLRQAHGAWVLCGAILIVKTADIGAYAVGCSIGRTKLIPWLSPKKTWEGLIGGIITAAISGALLAWASQALPEYDRYSIGWGALYGVLAALVGLLGDLIASAMKRDARIKDSSTILPGLGGVVDTMDSLLLVGPLAWWMLR